MIREAIILISNRTYTTSDNKVIPISMLKINDSTLLAYQLSYLDFWGVNHVVIGLGSNQKEIEQTLGKKYKSIELTYYSDINELGTGGLLKKAMSLMTGYYVLVMNGDLFFDLNLKRFDDYRRSKESDICIATRFVDSITRLGSVIVDEQNRIIGFSKGDDSYSDDFMNTGIYCLKSSYFMSKNTPEIFSFEEEFLKDNYKSDSFFSYRCYSTFLDLGTSIDRKRADLEFSRLPYR